MALIPCSGCGTQMSSRWPSCPACGAAAGERPRKKRFNPTVHYLLATALTTLGALVYGAQLIGGELAPGLVPWSIAMIVVGAAWYGGVRILALFR